MPLDCLPADVLWDVGRLLDLPAYVNLARTNRRLRQFFFLNATCPSSPRPPTAAAAEPLLPSSAAEALARGVVRACIPHTPEGTALLADIDGGHADPSINKSRRSCHHHQSSNGSSRRHCCCCRLGPAAAVLARVHATRAAIAAAEPYSVAVLAEHVHGFGLSDGRVCYLQVECGGGWKLRVLDMRNRSARREFVFDLVALLRAVGLLPAPAALDDDDDSNSGRRSDGQTACAISGIPYFLNYSHDVLSFLWSLPGIGRQWLVVVDVAPRSWRRRAHPVRVRRDDDDGDNGLRVLFVQPIDVLDGLLVRNNDKHLFYGTHTVRGPHGFLEWVITGVDLATAKPLTSAPMRLDNFKGEVLGKEVWFELDRAGAYFYAVSNQTGFTDEEIDYTSFYTCLRFPVARTGAPCQWRRIWRREHREGPLDDRWTDLSLRTDPGGSGLIVVECRREHVGGRSDSWRTCYLQPLAAYFDEDENQDQNKDGAQTRVETHSVAANNSFSSTGSSSSSSSSTVDQNSHNQPPTPPVCRQCRRRSRALPTYFPPNHPPNHPLRRLADAYDHPNYMPPQPRLPRYVHTESSIVSPVPGLGATTAGASTRFKHRTYHLGASAFVDLVDASPPQAGMGGGRKPARLVVRVAARRQRCPIDYQGEEGDRGMLFPRQQWRGKARGGTGETEQEWSEGYGDSYACDCCGRGQDAATAHPDADADKDGTDDREGNGSNGSLYPLPHSDGRFEPWDGRDGYSAGALGAASSDRPIDLVREWPSPEAPSELTSLLCPPTSRRRCVRGLADDRLLVYMVDDEDGKWKGNRLVVVNFDPAIRLAGLGRLSQDGDRNGDDGDGFGGPLAWQHACKLEAGAKTANAETEPDMDSDEEVDWDDPFMVVEPAQYLCINRGFQLR